MNADRSVRAKWRSMANEGELRMRKSIHVLAIAMATFAVTATSSFAHHGWSWTTGENIDLTGIIKSARLGNPHGLLTVLVDGEIWTK
jgi:hypothetical protein